MKRYWYKEAVIYSMDIRSFKDGDGDGIGDFRGLLDHFDYLVQLGVTCLWILPFHPSGGRDFGYDVTDYYSVDPQLGTLDELKEVVKKATAHNIKIIIDLVVNHTSDKHPWFLEAQQNKQSPCYEYYIWAKEKPANDKEDVIFKNVENSNWAYNNTAKEYYYHTFYSFQPDLNIKNPAVKKEILKYIRFWMEYGIAGFRIDALPHLLRRKGPGKFKEDPFEIINTWKETITGYFKDAILVAEADVEPEEYKKYFAGKKVDGLFNFYGNNYFFFSLATKNPAPLVKAFKRLPPTETGEFYINFLRNHDELDLERLTEEEREKTFAAFAPEEDMRLYGRGIRRRLPPMVHNNRKILDLCFSLLLSLPGTPVIRYGEETGMGDDLRLRERNSVRSAMQWTADKNGGFTTEVPAQQVWPVISGGEYGYERVNVASQEKDSTSLLQLVRKMIRAHHRLPAFCYGAFEQLSADHEQVMGHICRCENHVAFAVHSFSENPVTAHLVPEEQRLHEFSMILGNCKYEFAGNRIVIQLPPYGFGWWALPAD